MSYNADSDLFYGVLLPEDCEIEEDVIEAAGFKAIYYGNFLSGPFPLDKGIAIRRIRTSEGEANEVDVALTLKDGLAVKKLMDFLNEHKVTEYKIAWYITCSYG